MDELIGRHVIYIDYIGLERSGKIIGVEPYPQDNEQRYLYIEDDDPEYNIHEDEINGEWISYAELRPSSEVYLD